jgi:hypothetical protein
MCFSFLVQTDEYVTITWNSALGGSTCLKNRVGLIAAGTKIFLARDSDKINLTYAPTVILYDYLIKSNLSTMFIYI